MFRRPARLGLECQRAVEIRTSRAVGVAGRQPRQEHLEEIAAVFEHPAQVGGGHGDEAAEADLLPVTWRLAVEWESVNP